MTQRTLGAFVSTLILAFAVTSLASSQAEAKGFAGKIITSHKRFPTYAKSKSAYMKKLRKQRRTKFQEDKENKQWKIYFAAFFKKPLNDLEVTIKIYDITEKSKLLKVAFEQYLNSRGQKEIISHLTLERDKFGVNRKLEMIVENRGRVLAKGQFFILGEAEKHSGKVEFTEEETHGP